MTLGPWAKITNSYTEVSFTFPWDNEAFWTRDKIDLESSWKKKKKKRTKQEKGIFQALLAIQATHLWTSNEILSGDCSG